VTIEGNVGKADLYLGGAAVTARSASLSLAGSRVASNRLEVIGTLPAQIGGGVLSVSEGTLTVTGGQIVGNTMLGGSVQGGLVRVIDTAYPSEIDESLSLDGVEIADNAVTTTKSVDGGLVWAVGQLTMKDCSIRANTVGSTGASGGLVYYVEVRNTGPELSPPPGVFVVEGTRVEGNTVTNAATGGLFYLRLDRLGPVVATLAASTFLDNSVSTSSWTRGGLFYFEEARHVRIADCIVRGNAIDAAVDGTGTLDGGISYHSVTRGFSTDPDPEGDVELARTDVSDNRIGTARAPGTARGGVVSLYAPWHAQGTRLTVAVTNATFSQNVVRASSSVEGAIVNVFNRAGADVLIALDNVTLALNQTNGSLGSVFDFGGPPADYRPAVVQLRNTILAQNAAAAGADCPLQGPLSQTLSSGYNLLGDVTACPGLTPASTDQVGVDPLFGEYGDNGGLVSSLAILPESPAVDGGDPAGCVDLNGATLPTDQRGLPRPVGPRCDVGAFELQGP
jgi:hypothetical protein